MHRLVPSRAWVERRASQPQFQLERTRPRRCSTVQFQVESGRDLRRCSRSSSSWTFAVFVMRWSFRGGRQARSCGVFARSGGADWSAPVPARERADLGVIHGPVPAGDRSELSQVQADSRCSSSRCAFRGGRSRPEAEGCTYAAGEAEGQPQFQLESGPTSALFTVQFQLETGELGVVHGPVPGGVRGVRHDVGPFEAGDRGPKLRGAVARSAEWRSGPVPAGVGAASAMFQFQVELAASARRCSRSSSSSRAGRPGVVHGPVPAGVRGVRHDVGPFEAGAQGPKLWGVVRSSG